VSLKLDEFRDLVKQVVHSACRTALLDAGFTPDDYFNVVDTSEAPGTDTGGGVTPEFLGGPNLQNLTQ